MSDPTSLPPLPSNHLDHPEQWTTGSEPATEKQKGFIAVLEKQNPGLVPDEGIEKGELGKSEASEIIDSLKKGERVEAHHHEKEKGGDKEEKGDVGATKEKEEKESSAKKVEDKGQVGEKRKEHPNSEENDEGKKDIKSTQESEKDELVSSQDIDVDEDEKDPKQTTLDGVFDGSKSEDKEDRASKKPKLDDSTSNDNTTPSKSNGTSTSTSTSKANQQTYDEAHPPVEADSGATYPKPTETDTIPGSPTHLDHPENWATGDDPATDKQKGFIKVLEKQKGTGAENVEGMGKSEASERIEELREM
ncbi:hypothetical protein I302_103271 [Kwoniella bestiolae CBS 10118]|uniref:Uncharacterized protein n=1 Tax=Kwoniella bestiolae CBS 10118 TaxID=1296100 RepID=A0A1B9G7X1_9TREE|nr:hypothetical protein I302_01970 [Kwoniella bestiolae CBS 10118]OCF27135.1 hypothetical protein I302_01970 [Kwoniella bestiolae CBS 10118]